VDLARFARVVWRFRVLVAVGLSLALALSFLSLVRVDVGAGFKVTYRENEQWETLSTLFVSSPDFRWGSLSSGGSAEDPEAAQAAEGRIHAMTALYMQGATMDKVLALMMRQGPIDGVVQTFPVTAGADGNGDPLPMITFSAIAPTPAQSHALAKRHIRAFLGFLRRNQRGVPADERVLVEVVRQPQAPVLLQPRKKTRPIIVFLTVAIATIGLAFILENIRPRVRVLPGEGKPELPARRPRRRRRAS
jgi:hypothetical protein